MKTFYISLPSTLVVLTACLLAPLAQAQFAASTGLDYTTGDYGLSTKTTISTYNLTGEYADQGWTAKIVAPYEHITSPVGVIVIGGHPKLQRRLNAKNEGKTQTESGLGDIETSLSYNVCHDLNTDWNAVVTGSVKLPTADDEKGLGSGKIDYGLALDLSRAIGRFTPALGLGYRIVGNPDGADLRNYCYASLGTGYWMTDATNLNLTFECDQRSSASSNVDNELSLGLNHHLAKAWDLEAHILAGLSTAAPNFGLGASVRYTF